MSTWHGDFAKLQPGVPAPARVSGGRVFIAPLGAGLQSIPRIGFTRVTVDGANVETPGTVGSLLQISPEVVDQVQVSTANFDASTGLATGGAVDVVTRSGGNDYHASAFTQYRDRHWSASPLVPGTPASTPPFRRHQSGGTLSGPLSPDRLFFLASFERHDQGDVIRIQPDDPHLAPLGGTFVTPSSSALTTVRIDLNVKPGHHAFLRHSHDVSSVVDPGILGIVGMAAASGWAGRPVRAWQTMGSVTSVLGGHVVNELRASIYGTDIRVEPMSPAECHAPCIGLDGPRVLLSNGVSTVLAVGPAFPGGASGRRLQVSNALAWHRGRHLIRAGADWESVRHRIRNSESDPVQIVLWAPAAVEERMPSRALPTSFASLDSLLDLPLRSFTTSIGPADVLQRGFQPIRRLDTIRLHAADRWDVRPGLSLNLGFAWSYEPGVLNDDLDRPAWLAPLVGSDELRPPAAYANWSGTAGVAWTATRDGRTIVRAGVGRYVESMARAVSLNLANERRLLSPIGTNRVVVSSANLTWNGTRLAFPEPTDFTGRDLLAILPAIRDSLAGLVAPDNRDFSHVNLDIVKEGSNLSDPSYTTPRALHLSAGVERQIGDRIVVSGDVVWKRFTHAFINGIDYNRFQSAAGPVIPACTAVQRTEALVACSNGSLYFDTTSGRARYAGLLLRAERRLNGAGRILASYALGSFVGTNGTGTGTTENSEGRAFGFNNDNWLENYGPLPTDVRHLLNVSGFFGLPWRMHLALNWAAASRPPFSAYVAGMDFNGDGTSNDLLPGTRVNQFGRGLTERDLVRLVDRYNADHAGRLTAGGQVAPVVTLPAQFAFNDRFSSVDVRLARTSRVGGAFQLSVHLDVFNVFNTMNLTGYAGNLSSQATFGQPTSRVGQAFGSGGPRAIQVGMRMSY